MVSQPHKIRRQVLEIGGCSAAEAPRLQAALRDIYYRRLLPAIDKACSEAGATGRVDRIERLEIDLGPASIDALEASWTEAFDRSFSPALARSLAGAADAGEPGTLRSHLELFGYFLQTGTVPWWADRSDPALLETALSMLVAGAPAALLHVIDAAPDRRAAWRRIVIAYSDRALEALARLRTGSGVTSPSGFDVEWLRLVTIAAGAQGIPASAVRPVWWQERLGGSATGHRGEDASRAAGAVLPLLAERLGLSYPRLVADLRRPRAGGEEPPVWARAVLDSLDAAVPAEAGHDAAAAAEARAGLTALLAGSDAASFSADAVSPAGWARAEALLARLSAAQRASMRARLSEVGRAWMREQPPPDRDDRLAPRTEAERSDLEPGAGLPTLPAGGARQLVSSQSPRSPRLDGVDLRFSDVDAIEVDNAGLVLFWPFLERFFTHLDLVHGKAFVSEAARQRAVGLLQYLATGDPAGPEFLVPLNKVLCGMTPETVFDFGSPIAPAETTAAADLLTAVIHNAPVLRGMSTSGFRGSFLLRQGQLSARDGHFLLRVARETHDIVLDRFPWSSSLVKLPWMTALMQVEW